MAMNHISNIVIDFESILEKQYILCTVLVLRNTWEIAISLEIEKKQLNNIKSDSFKKDQRNVIKCIAHYLCPRHVHECSERVN